MTGWQSWLIPTEDQLATGLLRIRVSCVRADVLMCMLQVRAVRRPQRQQAEALHG